MQRIGSLVFGRAAPHAALGVRVKQLAALRSLQQASGWIMRRGDMRGMADAKKARLPGTQRGVRVAASLCVPAANFYVFF